MGMFDYIRCEVPLPDGWRADELQTKDFAREMVVHVITKEGRLMLERIDRVEEVPQHERPYPNAKPGTLESLCGIMQRHTSRHDSNFHGIVHFYGLEVIRYEPDDRYGPRGRPIYQGHDYFAKFTDGQLVGITTEMPS